VFKRGHGVGMQSAVFQKTFPRDNSHVFNISQDEIIVNVNFRGRKGLFRCPELRLLSAPYTSDIIGVRLTVGVGAAIAEVHNPCVDGGPAYGAGGPVAHVR
jgi:hypothetical protein